MGTDTKTQNPDEGELKRDLEKIACVVWVTSTGSVMPKLVKYQDEEGLLHTISQIHVLTQEKKYYCGSPNQEYRYSTVLENQEYLFRLYYYLEEKCWKISWEGI